MVKEYLEKLSELIKQAKLEKLKNVKLEIKHFFSGAAVYVNSSICITLFDKTKMRKTSSVFS